MVRTAVLFALVAMVLSYATSVVVALAYLAYRGKSPALSEPCTAVALAAGVSAGAVAFSAGLEAGNTAVVTTVSALYFVVAAVLGVLVLGESVGLRQVAGVGFAVVTVVLLSG